MLSRGSDVATGCDGGTAGSDSGSRDAGGNQIPPMPGFPASMDQKFGGGVDTTVARCVGHSAMRSASQSSFLS